MTFKPLMLGILLASGSPSILAGLTPEQVLGDYRSAPGFGEAQAQELVVVELGTGTIHPRFIEVRAEQNIRFLFRNYTDATHLMVMTLDREELLNDDTFTRSYLEHGSSNVSVPGGHHHSHGDTSAENASPMVKRSHEHPAVLVKAGDSKEVLVRFAKGERIELLCLLDEHYKQGMSGTIVSE